MDMHSTTAPAPRTGYYEDEIDLRQYVDVIIAWWREIIFITILASVIGGLAVIALRAITPTTFEATSVVIIARITSDINIDEAYRTSLDDAQTAGNAAARREAFVGLVANATIARLVIDDLRDILPEELSQPVDLLNAISAEYSIPTNSRNTLSDLIQITATAPTRELAAAIASSWAAYYVDYINALYGRVPDEIFTSVEVELAKAEIEYDESQVAYEAFISSNDLTALERQIHEKTTIIAQLRAGKETAIASLLEHHTASRQTAINAYLNAANNNRRLAFQMEQESNTQYLRELVTSESESRLLALRLDREARTNLFQQYVNTLIHNRRLALDKEQEVRAALFTQYVDAEIANRIKALTQEQLAKTEVFQAYSNAELSGKLAVLNEQVASRLKTLALSYDTRRNLLALLDNAHMLQAHLEESGDAALTTNQIALMLLKIQANSADTLLIDNSDLEQTQRANTTVVRQSAGLSFMLNLDSFSSLEVSAADQMADIRGLVNALQARIEALNASIDQQSQRLFYNEDYQLLDASPAEDDPLHAAIREKYLELFTIDELAQTAVTLDENSALSDAIMARYEELFGLGSMVNLADDSWDDSELSRAITDKYNELFGISNLLSTSLVLSDTAPLYQTIETNYPQLFDLGSLAQVAANIAVTTPLNIAGYQGVEELLSLESVEEIPGYMDTAAPIDRVISELEDEVQILNGQQEGQQAHLAQLQRQRDLAQRAYETLDGKIVELTLQRTAANREVLLGAPAIPPESPVLGPSPVKVTALAAVVGFLFAIFFVFVAAYLGKEPFLRSTATAATT